MRALLAPRAFLPRPVNRRDVTSRSAGDGEHAYDDPVDRALAVFWRNWTGNASCRHLVTASPRGSLWRSPEEIESRVRAWLEVFPPSPSGTCGAHGIDVPTIGTREPMTLLLTKAEAARAAFDTKYAARQRQGLPQVVTDRMLKRVGVFCGTPLIFGFATGPAFYYAKAVRGIDVPSWVFFTASTATFGAAVVGISYGVLSASWDPRREGSFWGFAEFKENVPIVVSTIMGKARGEVPLEWDDETDEDF